MTVPTFAQPDYSTQSGVEYPSNIDGAIKVMDIAAHFAAHEAAVPDMTVVIDAGRINALSVAQQITSTITAPSVDPRIDRVVLDNATGIYEVVTGAEAASPVAPAVPAGKITVCQIALIVSQSSIVNSNIIDERSIVPSVSLTNMGVTSTAAELNLNDGAVLRHKVIDIGDWNMDADPSISVVHGLTMSKIRALSAMIRDDAGTTISDISLTNGGTGFNGINISSIPAWVNLYRFTGGFYDFTDYNATSYNRGWVTIWYVD